MSIKNNAELYQYLRNNFGRKFGPFTLLGDRELSQITELELTNIPSLNGIEQLENLQELRCLINDPNIDMESYVNASNLPNLQNVDYNIPNVRFFDGELLENISGNTTLNVSSSFYPGLENYSSEDLRQIHARLDEIKGLVRPEMSEAEIAEVIYEEIGSRVEFDDNNINVRNNRNNNLLGTLIDDKAVCSGIALSLETALRDNGIEAISCGGLGGKEPGPHQWNQARIDGEWYNLDLTFDCASDKEGFMNRNWEYFLVSDEKFLANHQIDRNDTSEIHHECTSTRFDNAFGKPETSETMESEQLQTPEQLPNTKGREGTTSEVSEDKGVQTGQQLVDGVVDESKDMKLRAGEISDTNGEINQAEIAFVQPQQSMDTMVLGG
ncbi:MAG: hypothetical protein FWC79_07760 [Oscillospiraceae bacterium]|nr:hypothetical protein [Oscillospiraceae bacterium]